MEAAFLGLLLAAPRCRDMINDGIRQLESCMPPDPPADSKLALAKLLVLRNFLYEHILAVFMLG